MSSPEAHTAGVGEGWDLHPGASGLKAGIPFSGLMVLLV